MTMSGSELFTALIAVAGLLLGLRSEWREYARGKPRLRVIPKVAFPMGPMPDTRPCFAFEVINEGHVAVTVTEVGFFYEGTDSRGSLTPILPPGTSWPHRLEPHSSVVVYSEAEAINDPAVSKVACAYAATASDQVFEGTSDALKHLITTGAVPLLRRTMSRTGLAGYLTVSSFDNVA